MLLAGRRTQLLAGRRTQLPCCTLEEVHTSRWAVGRKCLAPEHMSLAAVARMRRLEAHRSPVSGVRRNPVDAAAGQQEAAHKSFASAFLPFLARTSGSSHTAPSEFAPAFSSFLPALVSAGTPW